MEMIVKLGAQVTDIDIHDIRIAAVVIAPHFLQDLIARQDRALVAEQIFKQRILLFRQMDRLPADLHLIAARIHRKILDAQAFFNRRFRFHGRMLAQGVADARQELFHRKRLRDVIIGTEIQAGDLVFDIVAGRQHDDGDIRDFTNLLADGHAIHAGQHDIEQNKVVILLHDALKSTRAIALNRRLKAFMVELDLQETRNARFIFHDKNTYRFIHIVPS